MLREKTGVHAPDDALSHEVLSRFTVRPWMLDIVKKLKQASIRVTILSDQTKWLDEFAKSMDSSNCLNGYLTATTSACVKGPGSF